jgi:plastocyanin
MAISVIRSTVLRRRRGLALGAFALLVAAGFGCGGVAAEIVHTVSQKHRTFHPGVVHLVQGDVLHIINDDEYNHQIYIDAPNFKIDTDEKAPGQTVDITFSQSGTFDVYCHIHPRMHLKVVVTPR